MTQIAKLPDFLIIGAAKAGTTALFRAVSQHPGIFCSPDKEPRFFAFAGQSPSFTCPGNMFNAEVLVTKESDYLHLFSRCPSGAKAGEASAIYLSSPSAPETAARCVPGARLIAILRHPVERGYSQWLHRRQEGFEKLGDFEEAWAEEDNRVALGWSPLWEYRNRGYYGRQLTRWLEFFPREQLLILFYEDWLNQPVQTLELIWRHIGVEPVAEPVITRENVTSRRPRWRWLHRRMVENNALRRWAQRNLPLAVRDAITDPIKKINLVPGPRLDPLVRAQLAPAFHEDLRTVESLTQRNLTAWRD